MSGTRSLKQEARWRSSAVGAAVVLIAAALLIWLRSGPDPNHPIDRSAFYSVDDGKTWFVGSADKLPPFEHEGSQAVRAYVYSCDGGKTLFVGYLERLSASARRLLEEDARSRQPSLGVAELSRAANDVEVKKPAGPEWVKRTDPRAADIMAVQAPAGNKGVPVLVESPVDRK